MSVLPGINQYTEGDVVVCDVQFRNEITKLAEDPTTLTFYYQPDGSSPSETITYTGAVVPSVGVIARLGVGWYRTYVTSTGLQGLIGEHYTGTGAAQAPGDRQFWVNPRLYP